MYYCCTFLFVSNKMVTVAVLLLRAPAWPCVCPSLLSGGVSQLGRQDLFWESHERTAPGFPEAAKELVTLMLAVEPSSR